MNISIIACAEINYYERQHHFECNAEKFDEKHSIVLWIISDRLNRSQTAAAFLQMQR